MIKSLKGKRNFAARLVEFPKPLLANSRKVPCVQKLLANTVSAIIVFNRVIPPTHTQKAHTYTENCVSTVYEKILRKKAAKCLILLDAGTGIEPVYTDLQVIC